MGEKPDYLRRVDDEDKQKTAFSIAGRLFQDDVVIMRASLADLQSELARLTAQCKELQEERDQLLARSGQLELQLNAVMRSVSWQITQSMHALLLRQPGLARMFRRAVKLVWWTVSLQLVSRLRERYRNIQPTNFSTMAASADPTSLTPHAREILEELKAATYQKPGQGD